MRYTMYLGIVSNDTTFCGVGRTFSWDPVYPVDCTSETLYTAFGNAKDRTLLSILQNAMISSNIKMLRIYVLPEDYDALRVACAELVSHCNISIVVLDDAEYDRAKTCQFSKQLAEWYLLERDTRPANINYFKK